MSDTDSNSSPSIPPIVSEIEQMLVTLPPTIKSNDRAYIAIAACIDAEINTRDEILGAAQALGFDKKHAAILLAKATGTDPERHRWPKDADGTYRSLI